MKPSKNLENKTPSETHLRIQLHVRKFSLQFFSPSGPDAFDKSRFVITLTFLGVTEYYTVLD